MDGVKAISAFVSKEMFSSGNGKACFTYAKEHENKLNRGEKQSGKRAGIARFNPAPNVLKNQHQMPCHEQPIQRQMLSTS